MAAEIWALGASSRRQVAKGLNAKGIQTAQGGLWSAMQVKQGLEYGGNG